LAEDPGPQRWGTPVSVLAAIIAVVVMRDVVVAGLSSLLLLSVPAGIQGITRIVVVTEVVMHRG
jgi:hypothetical protein